MTPLPTALPGVVLFELTVFRDARGYFTETYQRDRYRDLGIAHDFVQDNMSRSLRGTLRGLHYRAARPEGKLVHVPRGEIFDVAVDPQTGKWVGARLSEENFHQLWVPPGLLHGFCVLSEIAEVEYKCTELYDAKDEVGARWDSAGIDWPLKDPLLSKKDAALPRLDELRKLLGG